MRRSLVLILAVLGLAGVARAADTALQDNRAAAWRDARALLRQLRLPAGTDPSAREPAGDGPGLLRPQRILAANTVGVSRWWISSSSGADVLDYVRAHHPAAGGDLQVMTAQSAGTDTLTLMWNIDGPRLFDQQLQVTVAQLADGRTGIMAQATSQWMVPRPLTERVPAGVRSVLGTLRIGSGPGGRRHQRTRRFVIDQPARVGRVVRELDSLPISQPGVVYSCGSMLSDMPRLTLRFLSGSGSTLARAQVNVYPGRDGASGWTGCDPIAFWIGPTRQTPLTSRTFVRRIAQLIGANIS